jgi:hypothetical protein
MITGMLLGFFLGGIFIIICIVIGTSRQKKELIDNNKKLEIQELQSDKEINLDDCCVSFPDDFLSPENVSKRLAANKSEIEQKAKQLVQWTVSSVMDEIKEKVEKTLYKHIRVCKAMTTVGLCANLFPISQQKELRKKAISILKQYLHDKVDNLVFQNWGSYSFDIDFDVRTEIR